MNNNKILLEVYIPSIEKEYDIYVPVNKKIGTVKKLVEDGLLDLTDNVYIINNDINLYSKDTGIMYDVNTKLIDTDLKNGSRVILI